MRYRDIAIYANYGWDTGDRTTVIKVPERDMDNVEEYVKEWVYRDIKYYWTDITISEK